MNPYTLPDALLTQLLQDDVPYGDATTFALGIGDQQGEITFCARYDMVLCGVEEALRMGQLCGLQALDNAHDALYKPVASGRALKAGDHILTLRGTAAGLHSVWKTAQTLMEYLSGISSATADIVSAARLVNPAIAVVCTRKNFPGTKAMAIKAILAGGASPHRLNLSETLLIFPEHRRFLGQQTPSEIVQPLRLRWPERAVVVEVASLKEALHWLGLTHDGKAVASIHQPDILQLEKLAPETLAELKRHMREHGLAGTRLAAAGGVNAKTATAYAQAGADILVTSAPYFAPPKDVAVSIKALGER